MVIYRLLTLVVFLKLITLTVLEDSAKFLTRYGITAVPSPLLLARISYSHHGTVIEVTISLGLILSLLILLLTKLILMIY